MAKRVAASVAAISAVFVHRIPTLLARDAVPVVQLDVGTATTVGVEDLRDKRKEIEQAALCQRGLDSRPALTLA